MQSSEQFSPSIWGKSQYMYAKHILTLKKAKEIEDVVALLFKLFVKASFIETTAFRSASSAFQAQRQAVTLSCITNALKTWDKNTTSYSPLNTNLTALRRKQWKWYTNKNDQITEVIPQHVKSYSFGNS